MKKQVLICLTFVLVFFASCGSFRKSSVTIVDYDRKLFSNGELTTLLSNYVLSDSVDTLSVKDGFGVLSGNIYARNALKEFYAKNTPEEKISKFIVPHIIIPSLNIDQVVVDGSFNIEVPEGTYDIILIAKHYYPIHLNWKIKSQHKYSIDFYLGCTVIH
jgi:hypothetical protein